MASAQTNIRLLDILKAGTTHKFEMSGWNAVHLAVAVLPHRSLSVRVVL
jgi:hypothetical protein